MKDFLQKLSAFVKKYKYNILIVILIFLISLSMQNMFMRLINPPDEPKEVPYTVFLEAVENGEVDTIVYSGSEEKMTYTIFDGVSDNLEWEELGEYEHDAQHTFVTFYSAGETFREDMLERGIYVKLSQSSILENILTAVSGLMLPIIYIIFLMRIMRKSVGGEAQSSKDLIKTSDVRFSNIIGHDEILEDVKFIVDLLKDPTKGDEIGVKPPKGILLNGDPGTGKTLIAKAIAGEADVPFLYVNGSSMIEMFVGVGAKRVREVFKVARKNSPCVVFIDEIDSIGGKRDGRNSGGEYEQTLNALLQEMDGFTGREGIFIIAATNRADVLDSALTRAGRFDRRINVLKPRDWSVRQELFKYYLNEYKVSDDVDIENLSRQTSGFTGADVSAICNEAAIVALMKQKACIDMDSLWEAIDKIIFQGNRSKKEQFEEDRKKIAYHEAGHAVLTYLCGEPIARASIASTTTGVGGAVFTAERDTALKSKSWFENQIKICYAGRASEEIKFGDVTTGADNDIQQATNLLCQYVTRFGFNSSFGLLNVGVLTDAGLCDETVAFDLIQKGSIDGYNETVDKLRENYKLVEKLAQELLDKESLSGDDIEELLKAS